MASDPTTAPAADGNPADNLSNVAVDGVAGTAVVLLFTDAPIPFTAFNPIYKDAVAAGTLAKLTWIVFEVNTDPAITFTPVGISQPKELATELADTAPTSVNGVLVPMYLLISVTATVVLTSVSNIFSVGAAGLTAVSVNILAVEVVVGFSSAVLEVVETPTPFTAFTPILNTFVDTGVAAVVVKLWVFPLVTPAKLTVITLVVPPDSWFTPSGKSHS
jgi:hypothetical protein